MEKFTPQANNFKLPQAVTALTILTSVYIMSTLVFHGGEEVLYFIQLSATNKPMISKIETKSVTKKDFHIYLLCSVCLPRLLVGGSSQGGGYTFTASFISFCLRRNKMSHKKGQTSSRMFFSEFGSQQKLGGKAHQILYRNLFLPTRRY